MNMQVKAGYTRTQQMVKVLYLIYYRKITCCYVKNEVYADVMRQRTVVAQEAVWLVYCYYELWVAYD